MLGNEYFYNYNSYIKPYYAKPPSTKIRTNKVAIIGGGLAGCATAFELSKFGFDIVLFDQCSRIANGASGNHTGMLKPYLTIDTNLSDLFHTRGYYETLSILNSFKYNSSVFSKPGLIQYISDDYEMHRFIKLFEQRRIDLSLAHLIRDKKYIFYPNACVVSPKNFCTQLLNSITTKLTKKMNHKITHIIQNSSGFWIINNDYLNEYDNVIICASIEGFNCFKQMNNIPIYSSEGQISYLKNVIPGFNKIVTKKGYLLPEFGGITAIGATYRKNDDISGDIRDEDHRYNINGLGDLISNMTYNLSGGRVSTRAVTSDHLPIVGGVPDYRKFMNVYAPLFKKGLISSKMPSCSYHEGLYVCSGFGSKGLASSILSAKIISSLVTASSIPISSRVYEALHPARFWVKTLK